MYQPLSLKKNFAWTFLGNGINAVSLWGIISILTKLGNPVMVGKLELARAVELPILAITMRNHFL